MMWSKHSRRIDPISRSAKPFCQGEAGAVGLSRMPMAQAAYPQDNQLMSKHRVLSFKPQRRLESRGEDGQNETEQPDHSTSLGDSVTSSTRMRFSAHTTVLPIRVDVLLEDTLDIGLGPQRHLAVLVLVDVALDEFSATSRNEPLSAWAVAR
jgi:hypothetical protein